MIDPKLTEFSFSKVVQSREFSRIETHERIMKREEIEILIGAYIDNELPPQSRSQVESLVCSDAQAKSILQGYLLVRKAFQNQIQVSKKVKAPQNLSRSFWSAVDAAQSATVQPAATRSATQYARNTSARNTSAQNAPSSSSWSFDRLKNPRIYAYPLAVLVCALLIGLFARNDKNEQIGRNDSSANSKGDAVISDSSATKQQRKEYAPMSADTKWKTQSNQAPPDLNNITITCRMESVAKMNKAFPQLFDAQSVEWKSVSGKSATVFEANVNMKTFRSLLNNFSSNEIEIIGEPLDSLLKKWKDIPDSKEIKVRFSVEIP